MRVHELMSQVPRSRPTGSHVAVPWQELRGTLGEQDVLSQPPTQSRQPHTPSLENLQALENGIPGAPGSPASVAACLSPQLPAARLPADQATAGSQASYISTVTPCGSDNSPRLPDRPNGFLGFFVFP